MAQQLINTKMEPILAAGNFIRILNDQEQCDRVCVITEAAFHICRLSSVGKSLKKEQSFGWLSIKQFYMDENDNENTFHFVFKVGITKKTTHLCFSSNDPTTFLSTFLGLIKVFLPPHYNSKIEFPPDIPINKYEIVSPFLSYFVSASYTYDSDSDQVYTTFVELKHELKQNPELRILSGIYKEEIYKSLCLALVYSTRIKSIMIGGKNFSKLYSTLQTILKNNRTILQIHIFHYLKEENFDGFLEALVASGVKSIEFERIPFSSQMSLNMVKKIEQIPTTEFSFIDCSFGSHMAKALFENACGCKKLTSFKVSNDKTFQSDESIYQEIKNFLSVTQLTKLCLVNLQIDISKIFEVIEYSNSTLSLAYIDLSGGVFVDDYRKTTYTFPPTVNYIVLQGVRWKIESLIVFIGKQEFQSMVELDFSNTSFKDKDFESLANSLPICINRQYEMPSPMVSAIIWNNNQINSRLLDFFSMFKLLKKISLNECVISKIESEEVFNAMLRMMERSSEIIEFNVRKTMKMYKSRFIKEFKDIFISHPNLEKINISDNCIGDEGLNILLEVLKSNPRIKVIAVDGSEVSKSSTYVNFLQALSTFTYLEGFQNPKKDLKKLSSTKKMEREYKDYLKKIKKIIHRNNENDNDKDETDSTTNSNLFSIQSDSQSCADFSVHQDKNNVLIASWDILDESSFYSSPQEWEKLRQMFSFANIMSMK